jgi:hypothetical protein
MANSHPITPFPAEIDRNYFGAWLSGFTDGEGCFRLYLNGATKTPAAKFAISLRRDELSILTLIHSYLKCGAVDLRNPHPPSKPQAVFRIDKGVDLATIVVPHFERFPLMAKKSMDFGLWAQAVKLIYSVSLRPIRLRWTKEDRNQFYDIQDTLHEQREYR